VLHDKMAHTKQKEHSRNNNSQQVNSRHVRCKFLIGKHVVTLCTYNFERNIHLSDILSVTNCYISKTVINSWLTNSQWRPTAHDKLSTVSRLSLEQFMTVDPSRGKQPCLMAETNLFTMYIPGGMMLSTILNYFNWWLHYG